MILVIIKLFVFDLTGFLAKDPVVRPIFNRYLLGQAIGVFPMIMGNQLASFLSLENKGNRTVFASVVYIVVNLVLDYFFIKVLDLQAFGLALASSLGLWVFFAIQACFSLRLSGSGFSVKNFCHSPSAKTSM